MMHSFTGEAPFEIIYGKVIPPPILRTKDELFATDEYVRHLETTFSQVQIAIERSQEKLKKVVDKHRRQMNLKRGRMDTSKV